MGEGGAFGLRADHADIGEVVADKRLLRDEEIECVIVGDDDGRPVCRDFRDERLRHGGQHGCDVHWKIVQLVFTGFHDCQGQGQERQSLRQCLANMARPENEDGGLLLGLALQPCLERCREFRCYAPEPEQGAPAAALADFRSERNIHTVFGGTAPQHRAGVVYRHIFKLPAADGFPHAVLRDQHEGASLTRR
ncbi:hypothetical protein D3C87_703790 [compost metagenome]